jgi:hypothetical protein
MKTKKMPTKTRPVAAVPAPVTLAKGQLWKMENTHLEIMEVGKTLTHYRLFQNQKRVPTSLGGITTVQTYLRDHSAVLIRNAREVAVK